MSSLLKPIALFVVIVALASALAGTASAASSKTNVTVSNGSFALSLDSNIVVPKDAPNPQFTTVMTNLTSTVATCQVYLVEANSWSSLITVAPGKQASAITGWGTAFPAAKQSTIHYQLWCNGTLQLTAASKMTLTDHAG